MEREIDHGQLAWERFYMQFKSSPKLEALVKSLYEPLDELHAAYHDLLNKRWIDNAVGEQLDGIGEIVCMPRPRVDVSQIPFFGYMDQTNTDTFGKAVFVDSAAGKSALQSMLLPDSEYRKLLIWKIAVNNGRGTMPEIVRSFKEIFGIGFVLSKDLGNAKFSLSYATSLEQGYIFDSYKAYMPKLAGVGMELVKLTQGLPFGFRSQGYYGFGVGVMYSQNKL